LTRSTLTRRGGCYLTAKDVVTAAPLGCGNTVATLQHGLGIAGNVTLVYHGHNPNPELPHNNCDPLQAALGTMAAGVAAMGYVADTMDSTALAATFVGWMEVDLIITNANAPAAAMPPQYLPLTQRCKASAIGRFVGL
jgi:hypothetical protein